MNATRRHEISENLPYVSSNAAFFLDFDGTLVDIAPRPELIELEPRARRLIEALCIHFAGAVAVVTGRAPEIVDTLLSPLKLPLAAEHGSVRRDAEGRVHVVTADSDAVKTAAARLEPLIEANPGLLLERKTSSVALHYRQRPDLARACELAAEAAAANLPQLIVLPGKMVFELRPRGIDKGAAVSAFLAEAPFRGRTPVYAGDDITDERAFAVVNDAGGISVKIGPGDTGARYRTDRQGFLAWAESLAGLG